MPVDRRLWKQPIVGETWPDWHCPTCAGGYLRVKPHSFHFQEGAESRQAHAHEAFDHSWVALRFTALLICNNDRCQEGVCVSGQGSVDQMMSDDGTDWTYVNVYYPQFVQPSPRLIAIPERCPEVVEKSLRRAMEAQWDDRGAAANHIRKAVEALLDAIKQPRFSITAKGRHQLSLHERILTLRVRDEALSDALLAVKWIGNAGSHREEITRDDVFDAFDLIERVLQMLFDNNQERLNCIVKQINKRKKPQGRARRVR